MSGDHVELEVCSDCLSFIANGDLTGLDFSPGGEAANERAREIEHGAETWAARGYYLCAGDETQEHGRRPCEHCGDAAHGSRHAVIGLPIAAPASLADGAGGRIALQWRDGVVVGAMGADPDIWIGLTGEQARERARRAPVVCDLRR